MVSVTLTRMDYSCAPVGPPGGASPDSGGLGTPVLLVEDDADIQEAMFDILTDEGFAVRIAANGQLALDALAEPDYRPAIILLDLMMPVMDGHEFRRRQVANTAWRDICVVVISADRNARDKSQQMAAHGFLPKPINLDELLLTLGGLTG